MIPAASKQLKGIAGVSSKESIEVRKEYKNPTFSYTIIRIVKLGNHIDGIL